jgi:hypothetical protein
MTSGPHLAAVEAQLGRRWTGSQAGQTAAGGKMVGEEENEDHGQTSGNGFKLKTDQIKGKGFSTVKNNPIK